MQQFAALLMSGVVAALGLVPATPQRSAAETSSAAEVYVAELDADWNVAREIRIPCSAEAGCTVDLPGADAKALTLHVRFDAIRGGAVAVSSAVEDPAGQATVRPAATLTLDRTGFGAIHFDACGEGRGIIMMAVKVSGWQASPAAGPAGGSRI